MFDWANIQHLFIQVEERERELMMDQIITSKISAETFIASCCIWGSQLSGDDKAVCRLVS